MPISQPPSRQPLLTVPEAAAHLKVSVSTVRRLVRNRLLGDVHVGRSVRISYDELDRFQLANERAALS
ncbi:helix-turn-helix domain-containing protein [Microbacterium sp. AG1240]|uniref:helix-turn-helix domain-containing protein n=1 Tax=Microbacterium sp. AG1240 TaxID=2183992 RepID=UPI001C7DEC3D